jgi:hypothetical protein
VFERRGVGDPAGERFADAKTASGDRNEAWTLAPAHARERDRETRVHFPQDFGGVHDALFYLEPEVAFASAWGTNWYPIPLDNASKGTGTLRIECPPRRRGRMHGSPDGARTVVRAVRTARQTAFAQCPVGARSLSPPRGLQTLDRHGRLPRKPLEIVRPARRSRARAGKTHARYGAQAAMVP